MLRARAELDNEQSRLFTLDEQIQQDKSSRASSLSVAPANCLRILPSLVVAFVFAPSASYRFNADFEDHAEHEPMTLVSEHPEWETAPYRF